MDSVWEATGMFMRSTRLGRRFVRGAGLEGSIAKQVTNLGHTLAPTHHHHDDRNFWPYDGSQSHPDVAVQGQFLMLGVREPLRVRHLLWLGASCGCKFK